MSPCCLAAATATAVLTALIVVGLTAFVLVTDGFGLGLLVGTTLTLTFLRIQWIGPCPRLLDAFSALLGVRAAWLLATTRRPLVLAVWRYLRPRVAWTLRHATPIGWIRRLGPGGCPRTDSTRDVPAVCRATLIGRRETPVSGSRLVGRFIPPRSR